MENSVAVLERCAVPEVCRLWVLLASQVALFFTQEVGARIGLATGQGLSGLIREKWGVRIALFAALTMLAPPSRSSGCRWSCQPASPRWRW